MSSQALSSSPKCPKGRLLAGAWFCPCHGLGERPKKTRNASTETESERQRRRWANADDERKDGSRKRAAARSRALSRLAKLHSAEFRRLYEEESC